ncbi:GNAT family N-acetyltransferase [Humibacillus xanthopallidus]|uniref:Putative acetyltransferase n=1 Tax=Humibacillus xanthopallidus TaxID=412689 RepID=A0A543I233_9MICO|nr:GNAT family N-acetyltransferase [Humibacillus xanthopallidus]TQM64617.1 putative acetyltransferase [Humibacillus xanthopallidus]
MTLHLRDITEADLAAVLSLRNRAFGRLPAGVDGTWWERVAGETLGGRWLGVSDEGGELVGAGRIRPYEQAWGGRHLRMGGVAGVYVDPSARGQGVATTLTRGLITRMGELGDVVSCLFPTTVSLYRRSGYEVGGVQQRTTYAGHTLRALDDRQSSSSPARPRRARPDDAEAIHRLLRDDAERHVQSGPMPPSIEKLRAMIERDELITYMLADGVVIYDLATDVLTVEHLAAATPETAAALWGLVGSGSSAVPIVHTYLDPRDPLTLVLEGLPAEELRQVPWMARVIDLGAAFAGRGFSPLARAEVDLVIDDPEAQTNTGRWRLSVADGKGFATHADSDPVRSGPADADTHGLPRVGARGLSALWCGWSTSRLRQAGLLAGGSGDDDAALDAIFAAAPYLTEYF